MPKRSRQARQAMSQRQHGNRFFDTGLIDDFFECALDPDYEPSNCDAHAVNDDNDDREASAVAFTLADGVESAGEETDIDSASDENTDWEDQMAYNDILEARERIKNKKPRLGAMPSYTGVSRSSSFARAKQLREAARGCAKVDSYFSKQTPLRVDSPAVHNARIFISNDALSSIPQTESQDIDMETPMETERVEPEILTSSTPITPVGELCDEIDKDIPLSEIFGCFDDETEIQMRPPVGRIVEKLIKAAKNINLSPRFSSLRQ
ncbi:hypothetical protein H0H92_008016 [Tricholoma furcatifolium]|nr:hypothetical protein H0H92_008016 [Tricholoma furcatifolium]